MSNLSGSLQPLLTSEHKQYTWTYDEHEGVGEFFYGGTFISRSGSAFSSIIPLPTLFGDIFLLLHEVKNSLTEMHLCQIPTNEFIDLHGSRALSDRKTYMRTGN